MERDVVITTKKRKRKLNKIYKTKEKEEKDVCTIKRMREEKSAFLPWKTPWNREGEKEKIVKMSTADLDEAGFFL